MMHSLQSNPRCNPIPSRRLDDWTGTGEIVGVSQKNIVDATTSALTRAFSKAGFVLQRNKINFTLRCGVAPPPRELEAALDILRQQLPACDVKWHYYTDG